MTEVETELGGVKFKVKAEDDGVLYDAIAELGGRFAEDQAESRHTGDARPVEDIAVDVEKAFDRDGLYVHFIVQR